MTELECPNCKKRFKPNWPTRKFCSDECKREHRKKQRVEFARERWTA